jgi:peptidoglycan/LPS O-acetylase OafA/YrhL
LETRSDFLDCFRAFAILPVMMHHAYSPAAPGGGLGVSVFFVLSGYLIGRTIAAEGPRTQRAFKFAVRRLFRIAPLYYLAIGTVVVFAWTTGQPSLQAVGERLPGLLIFSSRGEWLGYSVGVLWTLDVEMLFYALVFVLVLAIGVERVIRWSPALFVGALSVAQQLSGSFLYLPELFLGLLLNGPALRSIFVPPTLAIGIAVLAVAIVLVLYRIADVATLSGPTFVYCGYAVALCTAIAIHVALPHTARLRAPVLSFIGRISFSLYLVHALVLDFATSWLAAGDVDDPYRIAGFFFISFAISTLTYLLIERPCISVGRSLCLRIKAIARPGRDLPAVRQPAKSSTAG